MRWGLKAAVRLFAPRHHVGAVAAVFDDAGKVLLVEHVFRTDHPWGLPGGWVDPREAPIGTVQREIQEELQMQIDVRALLCVERIAPTVMANHPSHLGLAYYARLLSAGQATPSGEILSSKWVEPGEIEEDLSPFQRQAIVAGRALFDRERAASEERPASGRGVRL
ncbi:MAG: NUDIX hydrolase [Acidobacteriota bacterium]